MSTSDRHDEPLHQTSRPTFVVDRARIDAIGARTVAEAIRDVPGLLLFRYGAFGALANYGLRGSTSAQTLVLLDGAPISAASSGTIDLGSFSTAGVSRIEIVESATSTLYGTSAGGGVINIITAVPKRVAIAVASGSNADNMAEIALGNGRVGGAVAVHTADNAYTYPSLDGFTSGKRVNADARALVGRIMYDDGIAKNWHVRAGLGSDAVTIGVPGSLSFSTPNARQKTSRGDAVIELSRSAAHSSFSITLSGSRATLAYADPDSGGESDTYDGRVQLSLRHITGGAHDTLVSGIDLSRESAKLDLGPNGPPAQFTAVEAQSAIYTQYSHAFPGGSRVYAGLRGEHDAPAGSILAPALGGTLVLGAMRLGANAGESYRVPTIIDLYYPGFSNPTLQPEKSQNADVTLSAPSAFGGVSLGWFGREATNLITLDANFTPQNAQRASIRGLAFNATTRPFHGIIASAGVTNIYRAQDISNGNNVRLRFEPVFESVLGLSRPLGTSDFGFGVQAHVSGAHVEDRRWRNGETILDAYARWRFERRFLLTLRARNFGNERYAAIKGYPAPGRTYEIELSNR